MAKISVLALMPEKQVSFQLCGPAAIRMMLSHFSLLYSQASLWTDVQVSSAGTQPNSAGDLPQQTLFSQQVCHHCGAWFCWYTTPEAMAKTLSIRGPVTVAARATYPATPADSLAAQLDSLERPIPYPAATIIRAANHWVVVSGYHQDDPIYPGAPTVAVGGRQVNGVHWIDPDDVTNPPTVNFLATDAWLRLVKSIDCGLHTNTYPTVVGATPMRVVTRWWLILVAWFRRWPPWQWATRSKRAIGSE
jgi:hypothetical protein